MRRPRRIELMLLAVVVLWALNLTVTRYILTHGFEPLPYATIRYGLAALVFLGITAVAERSLRVARADWWLVAAATISLWLNQLAFVFALDSTSASTIGLVLGATPIFAALLGLALGTEQLHGRFWLGAAVSFAGVALVALGAGGEIEGGPEGVALGVLTAATWAAYSVAIAPLMSRYSPYRISALVLSLGWVLIAVTGAPATAGQELELGWEVWALLVFATLGPLVATNVLWFRSLDRIGPARATLAANLQPFVAVVFALVLLSEPLTPLQVAGGVLIGGGIVLARRRRRVRRLAEAVSSRSWRGTESVQATTDEGGRRRWMRGSGS
jgi:drug/metabolite transporter (DMT)-like permease